MLFRGIGIESLRRLGFEVYCRARFEMVLDHWYNRRCSGAFELVCSAYKTYGSRASLLAAGLKI
jgi:hypothetical protein